MIYDIHCHLDLYSDNEVDKIIERARKNDVRVIITNSVDIKSIKKNFEYVKKYGDIVKLAIGFYPPDALRRENTTNFSVNFEEVENFIKINKKYIFAIGEVGLDLYNGRNINEQKKIFDYFLKLAEKLKVPAIIHSRKAEEIVMDFIESYECKKILHCFNGKFSLIKKGIEKNYYFSIPTNIVKLEHFKKMALELPKDRILTETDSPFLSPYKNKKNEPSFIKETIRVISKLWNEKEEDVEKILWNNFCDVFKN